MINFDHVTKESIKKHNINWLQVPDQPYRIFIIRCSGYGKVNSLFNLISHQPNIDKIYLYAKDPFEAKYHLLIIKLLLAESILMIQKLLLNTRIVWLIFMRILKNTI